MRVRSLSLAILAALPLVLGLHAAHPLSAQAATVPLTLVRTTPTWLSMSMDPTTGRYYTRPDFYGTSNVVTWFPNAAAFEANAPAGTVTLAPNAHYGTYFATRGGKFFGRNSAQGTDVARWDAATGSTELVVPSIPSIGGLNGTHTFGWGGYSGFNFMQDQTGVYVVGKTTAGDDWQVSQVDQDLNVLSTHTWAGPAAQNYGFGFVINGYLFLGDAFFDNAISTRVDLATGAVSSVSHTLSGGPAAIYWSDTLYDPTSDVLYLHDGGGSGSLGIYKVANASSAFEVPVSCSPGPAPGSIAVFERGDALVPSSFSIASSGNASTARGYLLAAGHTLTTVTDVASPGALDPFDALWIALHQQTSTLSAAEIAAVQAFLASGRRVVSIGDNSSWTTWNNSVLSIVGGAVTGATGPNSQGSASSHPLVNGVGAFQFLTPGQVDFTAGSPTLLAASAAVYGGGLGEALFIADTDWFLDPNIGNAANPTFMQNIADWIVQATCGPTVTCPADATIECAGPTGTPLSVDIDVDDSAGEALTVTVDVDGVNEQTTIVPAGSTPATVIFNHAYAGLGDHLVEVTVLDTSGETAACSFTVTVEDTTPPVLSGCPTANPAVTAECAGPAGTPVIFPTITATDVCDGPVAVDCVSIGANPGLHSGDLFPLGTTTIQCTAVDGSGNMASCTFDVLVQDTTPPEIASSLLRGLLWPARGGMIPAGLTATALDVCDGSVPVTITVFSDEPDGAPPYAPDATGTAPGNLALRMERAYPGGNGRVYLVRVTATDAAGNTAVAVHTSVVPIMPAGTWILMVTAEAAAGQAACLAADPNLPLAGWVQLLQFTAP